MEQINELNSPAGNSEKKQMGEKLPIAWHTAFVEAIMLELDDYRDSLEFHPEYQLTSEPLRIDCVVVKKAPGVAIRKNIAAIFREVNLLEYKSPDDYVSVEDFYKVYAYACLYASFEKTAIDSLTISFIESRRPEKLIEHLKGVRRYSVEENSPGIYTVMGDILPIQIIDSRKLSEEENLWLRDLRYKLAPQEIRRVFAEISRQGKTARVRAYLDVISRANTDNITEALNMSNAQLSFEEILEVTGWTAKLEARGKARGEEHKAIDVAKNMINLGLPLETIISATMLDPEKVKELYESTPDKSAV